MSKKLLHNYTFDASAKTIVLDGIVGQERLLMISNIEDNIIIYLFNQAAFGLTSYSINTDTEKTTLVLAHDTTAMADTDKLQIFAEEDSVAFSPSETFVDPVSKIRMSTPENLIDTDFEYGLQSTKWETLELVNNIPTFYSRNGDTSMSLSAITKTNSSEIISVTTTTEHGLSVGNPIIVQGTDSPSANGAFIVTAIPSTTTFQYKSKNTQSSTGSILDTYTQIFIGSVYQGTEFQLAALNSVVTDQASPSVLTVTTKSPTNFSVGTSFFLSNSVGSKNISFDSTNIEPTNTQTKRETVTNLAATNSADGSKWAIGNAQPFNWTPIKGMFFVSGGAADATATFNTVTEEIEFAEDHIFGDGEAVMYILGNGNSLPTGVSQRRYHVRTTSNAKHIYLTTGGPTSIARVNLGSQGANGGMMRDCLAAGVVASSVDNTSELFTFDQNYITYAANTPYMPMYTTLGGLNTMTTGSTLINYFEGDSTPRVYYLNAVAGSPNTAHFSTTVGGSNVNTTSTTVNGIFIPMMRQVDGDRNSLYLPKGGWVAGDKVQIDSTSIMGGMTDNGMYTMIACGAAFPNRFRFAAIGGGLNPNNTNESNFTNYGGVGTTIHNVMEFNHSKNVTATGETTGWPIGAINPMNWLPDESFFFVQGGGGNINVNTGTETITFASAHGFVDNKPYVYFSGYGNTVIGGLTDARWYYVRVVSTTEIYLTLTEGSTTKVNLTNNGANVGVMRSCFVRAYKGVSSNSASEQITMAEAIPSLVGGSTQQLMACYTTFDNFTVFNGSNDLMSYSSGGGQVVYAKTVSSDGLTLSFTNTPNGSTRDLNGGAVNSAVLIKVSNDPRANSIWYAGHGLETGNVVQHYNSTTAISGMSSGDYYKVTKINNNRISFQLHSNATTPVNFGNYGSSSTTAYTYFIGKTVVATGDYIHAVGHGLNNQDSVFYNQNSGGKIFPLVDGTTYYVKNAIADKFQLSTTFDGVIGSPITVDQTTSKYTSFYQVNYTAHGYVTGDRVQYISSTPIAPLQSGAYYYIYKVNNNAFTLHINYDGADLNDTRTKIEFAYPYTGTGTYQKTTAVDLENKGTGTQIFSATAVGASDGVYKIATTPTTTTFTLNASSQLPDRVASFTPESSVWIEQDSIRIPDHYFVTGQAVIYTTAGTVVTGLTSGTTYYVVRSSRNWIKLATTYDNAVINNVTIALTGIGVGTQKLTTDSITGEVIGGGTVSVDVSSTKVSGVETNFTSFFNTGDTISIYGNPTTATATVTSINTGTSVFTCSPAHGLSTGDMIVMTGSVIPTGTTVNNIYYVRVASTTTLTLHPTNADAVGNSNTVSITDEGDGVKLITYADTGAVYTNSVKAVTGQGSLELENAQTATLTGANFTIGTSLLMRADGFALHRPYDGGVELIPSKNPDSKMIRQTRKYFRYQSGKGIQVSFAVNFSPSTQIDTYTASGTTATIKTRYAHRLATGLSVNISGATTSDATNYWNGIFAVASIVDEYSFTVTLAGTPSSGSTGPSGIPEFYVVSWSNSALKCGLFDDQNGLYFEYNGSALSVCRRNSTTQISGVGSVTFKSSDITGTDTRFAKQLSVGDSIVIKGQTYKITNIGSDTSMSVMPSYRGTSNSRVVITKVIDTKVSQVNWNLDKCDGTGPSGFALKTHRIQMAYMDYSWYGAGKVRFGFKDQRGKVIYVHEFIHNNHFNEAYMRSGNVPARYEIENTGTPTYVPALAHWGTSVIMDGGFDSDSAYQFTASSQDLQVTGNATVTVAANAEENDNYYYFFNNRWNSIGRALQIATPSYLYNSVPSNKKITGSNLNTNTYTRNPSSYFQLPNQPYQVNLLTRRQYSSNSSTEEFRNLMLINQAPTGETNTTSNFTVTVATTGVPVVYDIPLISVRLAPSVDTNTIGYLGEREIINRMQLILKTVGILSTHNAKITLRLNGLITNINWNAVTNPSLSQLIYHTNQDSISGGIDIFNFRSQGGTGTSGRSAVVTTQELGEITTLGNSILGGNNVFPDGPDVLTVVAQLVEDPSTVSTTNPFNITGRISWTESQA